MFKTSRCTGGFAFGRHNALGDTFQLRSKKQCGLLHQKRLKSHSSHSWLERQRKDIYVKLSRYENYRSRAAYKLIQLDDKYKFLKPGLIVIDAGAAPGSWTQVICERMNLHNESITDEENDQEKQKIKKNKMGICIAVDLKKIEPVDGAICLSNVDFTSPFTQSKLLEWLDDRLVDCILSDMAPSASGQSYYDHEKIMRLNYQLLQFAMQVLKPKKGLLLTKYFDGSEMNEWIEKLKALFDTVVITKPDASRGDSREGYVLCRGYKG